MKKPIDAADAVWPSVEKIRVEGAVCSIPEHPNIHFHWDEKKRCLVSEDGSLRVLQGKDGMMRIGKVVK